ncbi:hypothetical protein PMI38_01324, partial [Pseudomonas sp. GM84]
MLKAALYLWEPACPANGAQS